MLTVNLSRFPPQILTLDLSFLTIFAPLDTKAVFGGWRTWPLKGEGHLQKAVSLGLGYLWHPGWPLPIDDLHAQ